MDQVICVSVNDAFVMNEWRNEKKALNVRFLPDGKGDLARGIGMLVPKNDLGFGERSWRSSMLVRDGVIKKMFIEPDKPGDPFEVSDADTMSAYLAPHAAKPLDGTMFSREGCPYCARAKGMLHDAGINFEELVLNRDFSESTIRAISGRSTVPQVFVNGEHISDSEDLARISHQHLSRDGSRGRYGWRSRPRGELRGVANGPPGWWDWALCAAGRQSTKAATSSERPTAMVGLDFVRSQGGEAQRRRRSRHYVEQPDRGNARQGVPLGRRS